MRFLVPVVAAFYLMPVVAAAQQIDQRIVGQVIQVLQAQLSLSQATLKATQEDAEAREITLIEWLKSAQAEAVARSWTGPR